MRLRSLQEFAAEVAMPDLPAWPVDGRYAAACKLIHRHRQLDLRHPDAQAAGLSLDILLPALLRFSADTHFIKFDPWDPTIAIKEFPPSFLAYQYNPYRDIRNRQANGQKPASAPGQKTDFLAWETFPDAEHYLIWTAASGRRYGILVQPVPIVPEHLIIASLDYNPATGGHYDQSMTPEHMADMHELSIQLGQMGYAMGFNDHDAGASVDHFHTQAVPQRFLPLVRAYLSNRQDFTRTLACADGVHLYSLGRDAGTGAEKPGGFYPANGVVLAATDPATLLAPKQSVLSVLLGAGVRFNNIGWCLPRGGRAEAFFPRRQECILNRALKAGYVEMSGMLVIPDKTLFESLVNPEQGEAGLHEASLAPEEYCEFAKKIVFSFNQRIL